MAAIFILLIIVSLAGMHHDIQTRRDLYRPDIMYYQGSIHPFDTVLVGERKYVGVVENVTNNLYHIVFKDELNNTLHGIYPKNQLQKVLFLTPLLPPERTP